jgi:hypothetical protein
MFLWVVFFICGEFIGRSLSSIIGEVMLDRKFYLRWERTVMIIRTWADSALVKHPVQSDLIETLLKHFSVSCAATIIEE